MDRFARFGLAPAFAVLAVCIGVALVQPTPPDPHVPAKGETKQPEASATVDERRSPEAERAANAKRDLIRAEIEKLRDHPWAGEYYTGDGLGVNQIILLAPNAGYLFEWHGCMGLYDRNYGSVIEKGGKLFLSVTVPNPAEGLRAKIGPEMIPLRWGDRHYLIPADDVVGFCNSVHQGWEPRTGAHGFHFLRRGDQDKAAGGPKELPPEFQDCLLAEPVETTITAVGASTTRPGWGDHQFKVTPVTFDAGKKKGLRVGTELFVRDPGGGWINVKLTKVEGDRSEAVLERLDMDSREPQAGWRASTRLPSHLLPR